MVLDTSIVEPIIETPNFQNRGNTLNTKNDCRGKFGSIKRSLFT